MLRLLAEILTVFAALFGTMYYLLCLWSARAFLRRKPGPAAFSPPVSILKPLRGADPRAYECLRSHCVQDYPEYEVIFGVSDPGDAAVPVVARLAAEFPDRARLVVCPQALGTNLKVSNLIQMLATARHQYLVVSDGDIRVAPDYLCRVVAPLEDARVGLVTALYRGIPGNTLGSKLEALSIADFAAGVLTAHRFGGNFHFGFGSTLALPRKALQAIGSFDTLADYLADDYQLATHIASAGYQVVLSDVVVETALPDYSLRDFWQHQLRWARTVRDVSPAGHFGMVFAFGVQWAVLALIAARGASWAWALLGLAAAMRLLTTLAVAIPVLRDPGALRRLWLIPLRDVQAVLVWAAAYLGDTVAWRGQQFTLKDGKLARLNP